MGCPDDVGCRETLNQIYEYLDGELDQAHLRLIRQHLEHCPYCMTQLGYEQEVRSIIERSCHCSHAPEELRVRIMRRITQLHVTESFSTRSFTAPEPGGTARFTEPPFPS